MEDIHMPRYNVKLTTEEREELHSLSMGFSLQKGERGNDLWLYSPIYMTNSSPIGEKKHQTIRIVYNIIGEIDKDE